MNWCLIVPFLALVAVCTALQEQAEFAPKRLLNVASCDEFAKQKKHTAVKAKVYYKDEFYLDKDFKHPLRSCLKALKEMPVRPSLFYEIINVNQFTKRIVRQIRDMGTEWDTYVELIPQVKYFLGPRGDKNEIPEGVVRFDSVIALSCTEKESEVPYNDLFFDELNRTLAIVRSPVKYLVLNAWHTKSMRKPAPESFLRETSQLFNAIVFTVDPKNAYKIGRNEATKFMKGYTMPVVFDMPGSPVTLNKGHRAVQGSSSAAFLGICWLLYKTFF